EHTRNSSNATHHADYVAQQPIPASPRATVLRQRQTHGVTEYLLVLEQEYVKRLSGVRLGRSESDAIVDLLFASSGIENEVVASATRLEVLPRLSAPVATKISLTSAHLFQQHPQETLRQPRRPFGLSRRAASTVSRTSEQTSTSC
ncbi:MAG: hypothetical protein ACRDRJ_16405, partial [Streptosporangiaceae bacterium]